MTKEPGMFVEITEGLVMAAIWLSLLLVLFGCATPVTRSSIAGRMDFCLRTSTELPYAQRCRCLWEAEAQCAMMSFGTRCWYGHDRDTDGYTVAVCRARRSLGMDEP